MKEFTTITELEILEAAWAHLVEKWRFEDGRLEKDPDNIITKSSLKKIEAQCDELRTRILKLEAKQH